jgi:phospholipid/cholesterol/gamma-HCH transport system ATP-binding protein
MIEFRGVHKSFGKQKVLDDVTLEIPQGRTSVIIGPSGTGKSVFIKLLVGLLKPDQGQIFIHGQDITKLRERDLYEVRKKFGMLFQDGALFDSMTVEENIAFPLRRHTNKKDREIRDIVNHKLAQVGLPHAGHKFPGELSGGMRKRVGIARGMANNPEIMLYDEPTSGLDPLSTGTITRLIMKLQRELDVTSVVVSHDIRSVFRMATRVAVLNERRIVFFGTPEEMASSDDRYLRDFLGGS